MKLFFDTETTGKVFFRLPASHASQPRLVQLGALLCTDAGTEVGALNCIIKPDGWVIPSEASAVHGITTEYAHECGIPASVALHALTAFASKADTIIAHNIDFDRTVVSGELLRDGNRYTLPDRRYCTMAATTDLCKLPGPYGYKWPKLAEAYRHLFGEELSGAHDAMADVRACKRIYFEINK